jgi:hypothetical protein
MAPCAMGLPGLRARRLPNCAAFVAERLGFNHDEALSLGKALTKAMRPGTVPA